MNHATAQAIYDATCWARRCASECRLAIASGDSRSAASWGEAAASCARSAIAMQLEAGADVQRLRARWFLAPLELKADQVSS